METLTKYLPTVAKALLTLAFGAAGSFKLIGAEDMVAVFDMIGWGQWFRYVTGGIEVAAVIMLWTPAKALGAALLVATMICAVLFHIFVLGPSVVPATILGLISAYVLWTARPGAA